MIRWAGFVLIVVSSGLFGCSLVSGLREQTKIIKALRSDLEYLRAEVEFRLLTLPEIINTLSMRTIPPLQKLYAEVCKIAETNPGQDIGTCLEQAPMHILPQKVSSLLISLFSSLGKQDIQYQLHALDDTLQSLTAMIRQKEKEKREQERNCRILCLCTGFALAIILI